MNIIELAKECNLYATENSYTLYTKELEAFATAIAKQDVDEFKAGLVPVAWMPVKTTLTPCNEYGQLATRFVKNDVYCVPLYALPLGETK